MKKQKQMILKGFQGLKIESDTDTKTNGYTMRSSRSQENFVNGA